MKNNLIVLILVALLVACGDGGSDHKKEQPKQIEPMTAADSLDAKKDSLHIQSDYDMSTVEDKNKEEFLENLAGIEKKFGEQWDFCTCVVKNDSINKAVQQAGDDEFNQLLERFDYIEKKCKAFLTQSSNITRKIARYTRKR